MTQHQRNIKRFAAGMLTAWALAAGSPMVAEDAGTKEKPVAKPQAASAAAVDSSPSAAAAAATDDATATNPFADAIAWAQKRTVKLYGAGAGREHGYASGILVSAEGHILTAHGIYVSGDLNARIQIVLSDGRIYPAQIERRNDALQLALLKIDAKTPEFFELADKPVVQKADWVLSVSNCFKVADRDEPLSVNLGVVSLRTEIDAKKRAIDVELQGEVLLIDAITSNPGAPGGALITPDKKLAGMVGKILESKSTNTRINYAVPADLLRAFMDDKVADVVTKPPVPVGDGKAELGLRLFRLGGKRSPAYIDRVLPDSPAGKAGLQKDDLVLAINGEVVRSITDYDAQFALLKPGQEISVIFKRKNDVLQVKLTAAAEKPE